MKLPGISWVLIFFVTAGAADAADPELMNLLLPSTKVVAGVNVGQAKATPFGQFLLARMAAENHLSAKMGFDPRTDLQELLVGTAGQPAREGLILAKGNFNVQVILAAAQATGSTVETYNGVPVVTGKARTVTDAVAFPGNSIAIFGDLDSVHAAIDRRTAQSVGIDPALAAEVGQLSGSLDAWSISTVPLAMLASNRKLPDEQLNTLLNSDLLKSIQETSGGIKFGQTVQFSGQAVADTSENATALANVVRFLGNMLQANAPASTAAAIAALIQSLSVQTDGNTLILAAALPESQLESLVQASHRGR